MMRTRRLLLVASAALLSAVSCSESPPTNDLLIALVGDQVGGPIDLPAAAQCPLFTPTSSIHIGTSVAIVPASTIDPTRQAPFLLATSCDTTNASRTNIYYTDPTTTPPALVATVTTPAVSDLGWGSFSLRADRGDLLGCTSNTDGHHDVYSINIKTGAATFLFAATATNGIDICDGIAWDASTDTVYINPDVSSTTYVYSETGTLLDSFTIPADCPGSGLAVSGDSIYQACNGAVKVYRLDKTTRLPVAAAFSSGEQRTEDLECDPFTFANQEKDVIWTKEAYLDRLYAFEIPRGTCNIAGAEPVAQPAAPNPTCCPTGTLDSDGDGLRDCWETAHGIYFDGDCTIDLDLTPYGLPDVGRKDLYVELDYMYQAAPNATTLTTLAATFNTAPVQNPPPNAAGVVVHFALDEQVTASAGANANTDFFPCTAATAEKDFDTWKDERFGTPAERAAGAVTLNAKRLVFRYGLMVQGLTGQPNMMGCAEIPGDDFVIAKSGFGFGNYNVSNQQGVILHELGHNLSRRHGGNNNLDNQPNYVSVMNGSLTTTAFNPSRAADLSNFQAAWSEIGVIEASGVPQNATKATVYWRSGAPRTVNTLAGENFDGVGASPDTTPLGSPLDLNNDGAFTALPGGSDWENLHLNIRDVIDYAPATHLSLLSNEEVPSTFYLENSPDTDGDGVVNFSDNCVFVPNPSQLDANDTGIGDACDVKPQVCVRKHGRHTFARFSYRNDGFEIAIPVGENNHLTGGTIVQGEQPTLFERGRHLREFTVRFDHKDSVTWIVNGEGVTANRHTEKCRWWDHGGPEDDDDDDDDDDDCGHGRPGGHPHHSGHRW